MPVISPDGKTLYFTRSNHPEDVGYAYDAGNEDIWYSTKQLNGRWSTAKNIGPPLNNKYHNFVSSVSPDGNTLLLGNVYLSNGSMEKGVSISHKTNKGWGFPEPLDIQNFYNTANSNEFYLSNDGKTLLMTVQRNDSYGDKDVYVSFLIEGNRFTTPLNLGPVVNSDKGELSPFLAADGVTLYFSSEGHCTYGSADVFKSTRLDDTWTNWTEPENLGPGINTPDWDAYYVLPASGDYAYMVSTHDSYGATDIFRMLLPQKSKPKPVLLVYGKVLDANTKKPIEAKVYYEILPSGKEAGIARSNPSDGEYKITLPAGAIYGVRAEAPGYLAISDNVDATTVDEYKEIEKDLELVPLQVNQAVRLNNIFFDTDKDELRSESFPELDRLVKIMNDNPNMEIQIGGHTDNKGRDEHNRDLSERRAKAVATYLISKNISDTRVTYKGFGKTKPVASNDTEDGRQMNRRVEFIILKN
jgi:outer membrane protein OmpA-like peptidoglycan-associated protein